MMSDELRDEVEAINAIYGPGSLEPVEEEQQLGSLTFVLRLPGDEASSLRLRFPQTYPAERPKVLGVHHSSGGKRGAGARDLALFTASLDAVFQEDAICLFDAIEEHARRRQQQEEVEEAGEREGDIGAIRERQLQRPRGEDEEALSRRSASSPGTSAVLTRAPAWTRSELVTEQKSTFVAHVVVVTEPAQAQRYIDHLLSSDRRVGSATHNITAWRIHGSSTITAADDGGSRHGPPPQRSYQDCDDDGETAAGTRLLHLMQLMDVWDALVVVTRWYGGVKLGPRRFALINAVARDALVRAGLAGKDNGGGGGKKKGKS